MGGARKGDSKEETTLVIDVFWGAGEMLKILLNITVVAPPSFHNLKGNSVSVYPTINRSHFGG
jgi:hypothetical protein